MTNEQWLIYLYGIWPNGGFTAVYWTLLIIISIPSGIAAADYNKDKAYYDSRRTPHLWVTMKSKAIKSMIVLSMLVIVSNLIPDKKTMLLLTATPTIMQSLNSNDGKLHRIDQIIDKALIKANKLLKDK